jgi:hypothetical protein
MRSGANWDKGSTVITPARQPNVGLLALDHERNAA